MKRYLFLSLVLALLIGVIPTAAQLDMGDGVFGVTITQERLNELAQEHSLDYTKVEWTYVMLDGEIEINATMERGDRTVNLMVIVIATVTDEGLVWNAVDWEAQPALDDTNGNERIQRAVATATRVLNQLIRREVRSVYDASTPYLLMNATITPGEMTLEFKGSDEELAALSPNIMDNGDGTFTVSVSEDMMNAAMDRVVQRPDSLDYLIITMENLMATYEVGVDGALCNNEVIEGSFQMTFSEVSGLDVVANAPTCNGEPLAEGPSNRIIGVLVGMIKRYTRLQTNGHQIVDVRLGEGVLELVVKATADSE
ncbi:MAG: hypothetical protein CL607_09575 [Anaerolineaceae bacterium]|nr:hypothetical protein [Anaerolineaceae bacterium]